jgi:hypothetical protein
MQKNHIEITTPRRSGAKALAAHAQPGNFGHKEEMEHEENSSKGK